MKRPQFLAAHMEWLYNHKRVFIGWHMQEISDTLKYSTEPTLCRNRSEHITLEEEIERGGLYSYIDVYGGCTTGNKLELYYEMIRDDKWLKIHCIALRRAPRKTRSVIFLSDIGELLK
jgi:hypothetical protein